MICAVLHSLFELYISCSTSNFVTCCHKYMYFSGKGYDMYGLVLAASTMVPLQGFLNFVVYAKPRYFNRKSIALFRSAVKRFSKGLSTESGSTDDEEKNHNDNHVQEQIPGATSPLYKSDENNKLSFTDGNSIPQVSEIVPFGAPDSLNEDDCKSNESDRDDEHQGSSNELFVEPSGIGMNTNNALDEPADPEMSSSIPPNERNPAKRRRRSSFFITVARRLTNLRNNIHITQTDTDVDSQNLVTGQHLNEDELIARFEMLLAG